MLGRQLRPHAVVSLPFVCGKRVSALAAFNHPGFLAWGYTPDTFSRFALHVIVESILPHLSKWPLPNSIVIIESTHIHMYKKNLQVQWQAEIQL